MSAAIVADIIGNLGRVGNDFLTAIDFTVKYTQRITLKTLSAGGTHFIKTRRKIFLKSGIVSAAALFAADAVEIKHQTRYSHI